MIKLYTLPNCGICKMIKTKLQQKNILFEEKNFSEIADIIKSDHAPALDIGNYQILNSPSAIVQWINAQE